MAGASRGSMRRGAGRWRGRWWPPPWCFMRGCREGWRTCWMISKKLTAEQRGVAFAALRGCVTAEIGVGAASVGEINRLNILRATLLAMARAVARLPLPPDFALVDGNVPPALTCQVRCVVGGMLHACRSRRLRLSPRWCAIGRWHGWRCGSRRMAGSIMRGMRPGRIARRCGSMGRRRTIGRSSGRCASLRWGCSGFQRRRAAALT